MGGHIGLDFSEAPKTIEPYGEAVVVGGDRQNERHEREKNGIRQTERGKIQGRESMQTLNVRGKVY